MFELRFIFWIIRVTSECANQPEIGKIASFSDGRIICQCVICVEALRKEPRGWYCYMQNLPKLFKCNGSMTSSFGTASKGNTPLCLQVKLCCHDGAPTYSSLHILFSRVDFGGQKLDNYYDLFMLALFENIRLVVLSVENYSLRTKWVLVSPLIICYTFLLSKQCNADNQVHFCFVQNSSRLRETWD